MYDSTYLYHHGIKGQKWGVRRYQYADGSLTIAGKKRYQLGVTSDNNVYERARSDAQRKATVFTGKQYTDGYLDKSTKFYRIQTSNKLEDYPLYATYKKQDADKYLGLFGNNLKTRGIADAEKELKSAKKSGNKEAIDQAIKKVEYANNQKVYQVTLSTSSKIKVPSDENAGDITATLMSKDSDFKKNLEVSIDSAKSKMLRPQQQILFNNAQKALKKDPADMTSSDKSTIYKAFNLSLTNHSLKEETSAQQTFYSELTKKGYGALLDYNDKSYSSYHADRPMIIFDTSTIRQESIIEPSQSVMNELNKKYNRERAIKEVGANTVGLVSHLAAKPLSEVVDYVDELSLNKMRG